MPTKKTMGKIIKRSATGLNDSTKDPAKIKKLREIVREHQYKRISGKIVDVQTANMILQVYDNLPADKKKDYAKKSIPEMARTGWSILSKSKSGLSDSTKKLTPAQIKQFKKALMYKWYLRDLGWRDNFMPNFEHDDDLYEEAESYYLNDEGDKLIKLLDKIDKNWWKYEFEDGFTKEDRKKYLGVNF